MNKSFKQQEPIFCKYNQESQENRPMTSRIINEQIIQITEALSSNYNNNSRMNMLRLNKYKSSIYNRLLRCKHSKEQPSYKTYNNKLPNPSHRSRNHQVQ